MAQPRSWKDLRIGLFALAAIIVGAFVVLMYGRVGQLRGGKFDLYVTTDAARGVIRGTEVWLDGQKVGLVRAVSFRSPSVSPKERVVIALRVLNSAHEAIRANTRVDVRAGGTLIGDQVVYLTSGTTRTRIVASGDTIHAGTQTDLEGATSQFAEASKALPGIVENVKLLTAQLKSTQSTIGAFGLDNGGTEMQRVKNKASRIMSRLSASEGTAGLVMNHSDLLMARAHRAMAQVDSIKALVMSDQHSFGRFRRDSTLMRDITAVRTELARVQVLANDPNGTVGRLRNDSAVVHNIHMDMAALDSLMSDIKKHPLRYIAF